MARNRLRRPADLEELIAALQGGSNVDVATTGMMQAAINRFRNDRLSPPSYMDTILGQGIGQSVTGLFGVDALNNQIAQTHLKGQMVASGGQLSPFDFMAAAAMGQNAAALNTMYGMTTGRPY